MDKDYVILKHEQLNTEEIKKRADALEKNREDIDRALVEMQRKLNVLRNEANIEVQTIKPVMVEETTKRQPVVLKTYDELFDIANRSIIERGLDPEDIGYGDLLTEQEIREIENELNALLSREEKWVKNDFIAVFIAALLGGTTDFIFGNRNNPLTGQGSDFAIELSEKFHNHAPNAPIDYQGEGFGGPEHRLKSKGHDILRFVEGIEMFKNGQFEGAYHVGHGKVVEAVVKANQYGTPYEQLSTINAILAYAQHMFGDLFSSYSLPFPGYSFIMNSDNRALRKMTIDMYRNGFNCKNIVIQSISTICIEVLIRIYYSIYAVQRMKNDIEVEEDYSNLDLIKEFFVPGNKEKLMEMLLLAHTIVTAANVGKITITKRIDQINITEIMAVVRYGSSVLKDIWKRNDKYGKLMRNADLIEHRWEELELQVFDEDIVQSLETREVLLIS